MFIQYKLIFLLLDSSADLGWVIFPKLSPGFTYEAVFSSEARDASRGWIQNSRSLSVYCLSSSKTRPASSHHSKRASLDAQTFYPASAHFKFVSVTFTKVPNVVKSAINLKGTLHRAWICEVWLSRVIDLTVSVLITYLL